MPYKYEESNKLIVFMVDTESPMDKLYDRIDELKEVYRKAKAFDEIVIETTECLMYLTSGLEEEEAGRITFEIIQKYEDELKDMEEIKND